jgi:hypothetical protein
MAQEDGNKDKQQVSADAAVQLMLYKPNKTKERNTIKETLTASKKY